MMRSRPCPPSHHHHHRRNNNTLSLTPGRYTPSTLFTPQHFKCPNNGSGAHCRLVCIPIASNASMQPCTPPPSHQTHSHRVVLTALDDFSAPPPYCTCPYRFKHIPAAFYAPSSTPMHPHHIICTPITIYASPSCRTYHHPIEHIPIALYLPLLLCTHLHCIERCPPHIV